MCGDAIVNISLTHMQTPHIRAIKKNFTGTNKMKTPHSCFHFFRTPCDPKNVTNINSAAGKTCFHENAGSLYGHFPLNVRLGVWGTRWRDLGVCCGYVPLLRVCSPALITVALASIASRITALLCTCIASAQAHLFTNRNCLETKHTKLSQNGYTLHYGQHNYELC